MKIGLLRVQYVNCGSDATKNRFIYIDKVPTLMEVCSLRCVFDSISTTTCLSQTSDVVEALVLYCNT